MTIHTTHNSQTRVVESGKFKKQLTLTDLTFIGLGRDFRLRMVIRRQPRGLYRRSGRDRVVG